MTVVAIPWQIFQLTHSNAAVGLVGLAELVPLIVFSILGGSIADRTDRRALVGWMQVGMLSASIGLALLAFSGTRSVIGYYLLAALSASFGAVDRPARTAMLPTLVGLERLPSVAALRQVAFQTTLIIGPAIGGLLIAVLPNIGWVFVIDALTFSAALIAVRWLPRGRPEGHSQDMLESIREGLSFAWKNPVILSVFGIDLIAMIFGMPRAVFPALASETFHLGARGAGLLYAAPSVGALVAALGSGWVKDVKARGRAVLIAVTIWGAAIALAGLTTFSILLTLGFLAVAGAADVVSAVFRNTILQEATPDRLRGRVSALNLMVVVGGPRLGDAEAGFVASALGSAPGSVVVGGVACLLGTAVVTARVRAFRDYRPPRIEERASAGR